MLLNKIVLSFKFNSSLFIINQYNGYINIYFYTKFNDYYSIE